MHTDTLIIGGGLSGLALAGALHATNKDFLLVEARDRLGGRILSETIADATFDLGPAWFWPGQSRMAELVARFGLARFDQFANGLLTYEDHNGVQRGQGYALMQGSYRLRGGFGALISAFENALPGGKVLTSTPVKSLTLRNNGITAQTEHESLSANHVVLALPPRIVANFSFDPPHPPLATETMQNAATWMAGQCKAVAVFEKPFWRDAGVSGHAMSRLGPMVEIHDASPEDGNLAALFGFIGVPADSRRNEVLLRQQIVAQFGRLFGPKAEDPIELLIKDWAFEPFTSTSADHAPLTVHPRYGLPSALEDLWDGKLHFAGTEVAPEFGGYLEGALEAAEIAFARLSES